MPFESGVDIIALTSSGGRARLRSCRLRLIIVWLLLQIILRLFRGGLLTCSLSSTLSRLRWFWCIKSGHCCRCLWPCWGRRYLPCTIVCLDARSCSFWSLWYWSFLGLRCWCEGTTTLLHYTPHWFACALDLGSWGSFRWCNCGVFRHLVLSDIIGLLCFIIIRHEISFIDLLTETRTC